MKKILLIVGLVIAVILSGDVLLMTTGYRVIANWGSIIIPSFVGGIIINLLFDKTERKSISKITAISITVVKLVSFLLMVKNPLFLAFIFIIVIYSAVSYLFINLGREVTGGDKRERTHTNHKSREG